MGYDRGDSFPFDFEPNGFPIGSKSKGKLSIRSYPIQFERKSNTSFLGAEQIIQPAECFRCNASQHQERGEWAP